MTARKTILLLAILVCPISAAAPAHDASKLKARLKESAEESPPAAELMLQPIDIYKQDGQVFGLIRTASKFSRAQKEHPRRAEVTLDLIKGYAAAARHEDVITTARQFLEIFPENALANEVSDQSAITLPPPTSARAGRPRPPRSELLLGGMVQRPSRESRRSGFGFPRTRPIPMRKLRSSRLKWRIKSRLMQN